MSTERPLELADLGIGGKIVCISMQRSGTSSVGDFLEQWGLRRAGYRISRAQQWSRAWLDGNYEAIFSDPVFLDHDVFEDSPWWYPDFFKFIYHRVLGSRFVLLSRDADSWFRSMIRHSNGFTLGQTDIHAKVYRREDDLDWLVDNVPDFKRSAPRSMTLFDQPAPYKAAYQRHTREAQRFFAESSMPDALFHSDLVDAETWPRMKAWLGLPDREDVRMDVHAHKARREFRREHLLRMKPAGEAERKGKGKGRLSRRSPSPP